MPMVISISMSLMVTLLVVLASAQTPRTDGARPARATASPASSSPALFPASADPAKTTVLLSAELADQAMALALEVRRLAEPPASAPARPPGRARRPR